MAVRKKHLFIWPQQELGEYGQAMGHPARVQVLELLAREGRCSFERIAAVSPLALSTVSFHFRVLQKSGWIEICSLPNGDGGYRLCQAAIEEATRSLREFCSTLERAA